MAIDQAISQTTDHETAQVVEIHDREFRLFSELMHERVGVYLSPAKKNLVRGRLLKRLRHYQLSSFKEYFALATCKDNPQEMQILVDLLTTNETYFFREEKHFDFLRDKVIPQLECSGALRVWSAASSTGEEAYSVAMLLADRLGLSRQWSIMGTDVNSRVLECAQRAHYPLDGAKKIPKSYLQRYCLKGVGDYEGTLTMDDALRKRVQFKPLNLNGPWSGIGQFDLIFLRNVMIYFDVPTKRKLVARMYQALKPRGYFFVGHSESLHGINEQFTLVQPSVYQRDN